MDAESLMGLAGGLIGLIAAAIGIYIAFRAFGYFEYLGGSNIPAGKRPVPKSELMRRLRRLGNRSNPFKIIDSGKSDFEVDWTIIDAKWLLGTSWANKKYHAWLYADDKRKTVRYCEMITEWKAGITDSGFGFRATLFRGVVLFQKERAAMWSIDKDGKIGKIYDYKFDPMDVKGIFKRIANDNGWEFVQVVTPMHASHE